MLQCRRLPSLDARQRKVAVDSTVDICAFDALADLLEDCCTEPWRHVVGVDIPFDEPVSADLVLETDQFEPQELLQTVLDATGLSTAEEAVSNITS